jgi:predicted LPLAT superfamily acyltransferase
MPRIRRAKGGDIDFESINIEGRTEFFRAVENNNMAKARELLAQGANKDRTNRYGETPLHVASFKGYMDIVRLLLEAGADIENITDDDETPLYVASYGGQLEVVRLLLEAGADKDKADIHGRTPLFMASYEGHLEVVRLLLEAGADKDIENIDGETPIDVANESIRKLLRDSEAIKRFNAFFVSPNDDDALIEPIEEGNIVAFLDPLHPDQRIVKRKANATENTPGWKYIATKRMNPLTVQPLNPSALVLRKAVVAPSVNMNGGRRSRRSRKQRKTRRMKKRQTRR